MKSFYIIKPHSGADAATAADDDVDDDDDDDDRDDDDDDDHDGGGLPERSVRITPISCAREISTRFLLNGSSIKEPISVPKRIQYTRNINFIGTIIHIAIGLPSKKS